MPITIRDLVQMPELRTRLATAEVNDEQFVHWAHVCELPDPTEWLGEGDLLMTTGIGIPSKLKDQEAYVEKLVAAGLSGLMIGENMQAPSNISGLIKMANKLRFPLLLTEYGVPFSSVIRAIIDANKKEEFHRHNMINRLCVTARAAMEGMSLEKLLQRLESDVEAKLMLLDPKDTYQFLLPRGLVVPQELREIFEHQPLDFSNTRPVVLRYQQHDGDLFAISIPSRRGVALLLKNQNEHSIEYSVLHYLVAVLGIAVERLYVETERALRMGAQLLDELFNLRLSAYEADKQLAQFDMQLDSVCLAIARPDKSVLSEWSIMLSKLDVQVLFRPQADELIMLLKPEDVAVVQTVIDTKVGVSNEVKNLERLSEALRETRLALVHTDDIERVVTYAKIAGKLSWLPSTTAQAAENFEQILGALVKYQEQNEAPLLHSLYVFLESNRSWVVAAKRLHVHKTTLIYRVKKIESITGRSLDRTEDVAILWFGLQSGLMAGLYTPRSR